VGSNRRRLEYSKLIFVSAADNTHLAIPLTSSLNKELTTRTPHLKTPTTLTPTSKVKASTAPPILLQAKRAIVVLWVQ